MAGGRFDKLVGKTLPGTYINFESGRETAFVAAGTRGTVVIPLPKADYGPAGQFIRLTNASPDAAAATLGHSIYDSDKNRQMLLLREAFKRATTVYAYILKEGNNDAGGAGNLGHQRRAAGHYAEQGRRKGRNDWLHHQLQQAKENGHSYTDGRGQRREEHGNGRCSGRYCGGWVHD